MIQRSLLALSLVVAALAPAGAVADDRVMVLGLDAAEDDLVLASLLTDALSGGVEQVPGWALSTRTVSLSNVRRPSPECPELRAACVASELANGDVEFVLYGSLRRRERARDDSYLVSLYLVSSAEREVGATASVSLEPREGQGLDERAEEYVLELAAAVGAVAPDAPTAREAAERSFRQDEARREAAREHAREARHQALLRRNGRVAGGLLVAGTLTMLFSRAMPAGEDDSPVAAIAVFTVGTMALAGSIGALVASIDTRSEERPVVIGAGASAQGAQVSTAVRF